MATGRCEVVLGKRQCKNAVEHGRNTCGPHRNWRLAGPVTTRQLTPEELNTYLANLKGK